MAKKEKTLLEKAMESQGNNEVSNEEVEIIESPQPKITKEEPSDQEFPMEIIKKSETQITDSQINLASKDEVDAYLEMYNYVKHSIVDKSDFFNYRGKKSMKKSGWRKFIKPFNLSVEMMREEVLGKENPRVYESGVCVDGSPDIHAEVYVIVSVTGIHCPNCKFEIKGQSIEAIGIKSKSEYWSEQFKNFGSYDRHNLIATARTRAENIGISDLVGFGEVSAEEFKGQIDESMDDRGSGDLKNAFGGK